MKKFNSSKIICFLVPLFFLAASGIAASNIAVTVSKTVDGDTLQLSTGEKVRLIGIDTPEASKNSKTRRDSERTAQDIKDIIAMGKEATDFTRQLVKDKEINLEYDAQKEDRYGRTLAYVYAAACGKAVANCLYETIDGYEYTMLEGIPYIFVNASIVKSGYAQVMTVPPNVKYQALFLKMQREAKEKGRGLWK